MYCCPEEDYHYSGESSTHLRIQLLTQKTNLSFVYSMNAIKSLKQINCWEAISWEHIHWKWKTSLGLSAQKRAVIIKLNILPIIPNIRQNTAVPMSVHNVKEVWLDLNSWTVIWETHSSELKIRCEWYGCERLFFTSLYNERPYE